MIRPGSGELGVSGAWFSRSDQWRFAFAGGVWSLVFAFLPFASFPVVWRSFLLPAVGAALLGVVFVIYRFWRPEPRLAFAALVTAQITAFAVAIEILNYLAFTLERPLFDANFIALDTMIGFDWRSFVAWMQAVPYASEVLRVAYATTLVQVPLIIVFLALTSRRAALDRFTLAFNIAAMMTVGFWILFPSFGAYHYYFSLGEAMPHGLAVDLAYAAHMSSWHNGDYVPLRLAEMNGLVAFPSFHTVLALLSTAALWRIRWLGPAVAVLNALVILSVPGQGGHHLVDVLAGAAVALIAFSLAGLISRRGRVVRPMRSTGLLAGKSSPMA